MSSGTLLYQQIVNYFVEEIKQHRLKPGDQLPVESLLMEQFNVSRITITRAMKEMEIMGLITRTKGKGTFVNEKWKWKPGPDGEQQGQEGGNLPRILSIVLPIQQEYGYELIRGAEEAARQAGYYLTFHCTNYHSHQERDMIAKLANDAVDGVILYPITSDGNIDLYSELLIKRKPFVIIDRTVEHLDVPHVVADNYNGMYECVSYLVQQGHRRIAFMTPSMKYDSTLMARYKGYGRALIDAGISVPLDLFWDGYNKEEEELVGEQLLRLMKLDNPPTAVVAVFDRLAAVIYKLANELGISIPRQLSLTGYDNLPICEQLGLTTVEQSLFMMGQRAAELLIKGIQSGMNPLEKIILEQQLVIRTSVASPAGIVRVGEG